MVSKTGKLTLNWNAVQQFKPRILKLELHFQLVVPRFRNLSWSPHGLQEGICGSSLAIHYEIEDYKHQNDWDEYKTALFPMHSHHCHRRQCGRQKSEKMRYRQRKRGDNRNWKREDGEKHEGQIVHMETGSLTFCDWAYNISRCSGLMSVRVCYWKERKKKRGWKWWKFLQTWIFHDQLNLKDSTCLGRPEKVFLYVLFGYFFFFFLPGWLCRHKAAYFDV